MSEENETIETGEEVETVSFEIPDDFSAVPDADLDELHVSAVEAFEALRADAENLDDEGLGQLEALVDAIERIAVEQRARESQRDEKLSRVDQLASRVRPDVDEAAAETDTAEVEETEAVEEPEAVAASAPIVINMQRVKARQPAPAPAPEPEPELAVTSTSMVAAATEAGFSAGDVIDVSGLSALVRARLDSVSSASSYRTGERRVVAQIKRDIPDDLRVTRPKESQNIVATAIDRYKNGVTPGVSQHDLLTASAWCAPSQPIYDLCELESTDGLLSLPSIGVDRGGVINTTGPDFSDIFSDSGFCFSASELDGQSPPGSGPKPCYTVDCPEFTDTRLGVCGTCVRANLLQNRAYPELVERTIRGALVTHAHNLDSTHVGNIIAGSTAVAFAADQVGAAAPVLNAVEIQIAHFRDVNRYAEDEMVEIVLPRWSKGAIRSDLSRRLGVDLLSVTDATISGWFGDRGASVQFAVNLDPLTGGAANQVAWPDDVRFLLYAPGTWVAGSADVIRIDTLFDSELLGTNDYTALFAEEGVLTLKTCPDSRVVTVPICPSGHTAGGISVLCDGTEDDES